METSPARHSQAFRDPSTFKTVLIPTRLDKKTKERFILWEDIRATFKNVDYIMHEGEVVLFMVDDNFKQ